jgi:hypothetical protein
MLLPLLLQDMPPNPDLVMVEYSINGKAQLQRLSSNSCM